MSRSNKQFVDRFFLKKGAKRCYYCQRKVHRAPTGDTQIQPLTATADHKYSRLDIRRFLIPNNKNVVLCCHECNDKRNELERIKISLDYLNYGFMGHIMTNVGLEIAPLNNWRL